MPDWLSSTLPAVVAALLVIFNVVICLLALGVFPGSRKPSTAMAWLILVLVLPYLGFVLFLLFGRTSVGRKRREWQSEINREVIAALEADPERDDRPVAGATPGLLGLSRLNRNLGALPLEQGNAVEIFTDYAGCFEAMRREIDGAERFVHIEFYISAWDDMTGPLFESLAAAADRGVDVRFLFDHLGSRGIPGYKSFVARLEATRIRWAPMLPIRPLKGDLRRPDLRNHRKILVVDGRVAFMGSQNLTEPGYNKPKNHKIGREWVELMVRIRGPAVRQLNLVFATDWHSETREDLRATLETKPPAAEPGTGVEAGAQVVPSGPGFTTENNLRLFNSMLYAAERRLSLTSPYFVPDESLLYAVTTAAQRGVDVELFVSATADQFMVYHAQRSYYDALLTAGVRIWLYPEPFVLHAKHFTVDDSLAVIGSSNMDMRSFALNYEVVLMLTGTGVVSGLSAVQDSYRAISAELTLEEWRRRRWGPKYVDNVMRLTAALQ
jgi:cardiolipin synthase A/B